MTEVPKIVYDRLRAASPEQGAPERAHPDADLLTAFAEQALSAAERDGVLQHLALCGDCREVVALALPEEDVQAAPFAAGTETLRAATIPAKADGSWLALRKFAWPGLRWAALAAGVVVVAAVLVVRPGKRNEAMLSPVRPPSATNVPSASGSQTASPSVASSPIGQSAALNKASAPRPKAQLQSPKNPKAEEVVTPHPVESATLLADNKKDAGRADELSPVPPAGAAAFSARTSRGATETVEVSGANAEVVAVEPSAESRLMARSDTSAIEKAKPAPQETEASKQQNTEAAVASAPARSQARNMTYAAKLASPASPVLAHKVTWAIAAGVLQRSLDNGQSWQSALRADHSLLCYATREGDLWTGGQAGTLFHSANGGITWTRVQPSTKGQALSSDVTHIELRSAAEIVVSTSNNEVWSSADGGKTWEKK